MLAIENDANGGDDEDQSNAQSGNQSAGQGQQGGGVAQQLLSSLPQLLGQLLGGGGGGGSGLGGGPAAQGVGQGSPLDFSNSALGDRPDYSLDKPQSLEELAQNPEDLDKLTNEELQQMLEEASLEELNNLCHMGKELEERLKEIAEEKKKKNEEKSDKVKEALQEKEALLANPKEGWGFTNDQWKEINGTDELPVLEGGLLEENRSAQHLAELYNGEAPLHGLPHQQQIQEFWNNSVKGLESGQISTTEYAGLSAGQDFFTFQQDALANFYSDPAYAAQFANWAKANNFDPSTLPKITPEDAAYNVGLTADAFNDRFGFSGDNWKASGQTPVSTIENFLWHAGYPGAANVDQGGAGSCWTCLANGDAYIWRPGELSQQHNSAFSTGQITSVDGRVLDVSNYIDISPGSQESYFNIANEPANQRSPLNYLDQQVIAQLGAGKGADFGGWVNDARAGAYQYVGLQDVRGTHADFVNSPHLSTDAFTPGHAWGKNKIVGIDNQGRPSVKVTANNSWGEFHEVYLPATQANFNSLTLPAGQGSLGFGGGGFGSLLAGGLSPGGGGAGGGGNGGGRDEDPGSGTKDPRPNPLEQKRNEQALEELCKQFHRLGQPAIPSTCDRFNIPPSIAPTLEEMRSRRESIHSRQRSRRVPIPAGIGRF